MNQHLQELQQAERMVSGRDMRYEVIFGPFLYENSRQVTQKGPQMFKMKHCPTGAGHHWKRGISKSQQAIK